MTPLCFKPYIYRHQHVIKACGKEENEPPQFLVLAHQLQILHVYYSKVQNFQLFLPIRGRFYNLCFFSDPKRHFCSLCLSLILVALGRIVSVTHLVNRRVSACNFFYNRKHQVYAFTYFFYKTIMTGDFSTI